MKLLVFLFCILQLLQMSSADIQGSISISNATVQQTGVSYTFALSFQSQISASGKLIIRFPAEYTTPFTPSCQTQSGFSGSQLNCQYSSTTRLLTLTGSALPNNKQSIGFKVNGVTNPMSVKTTGFFSASIYALSGDGFVQIEAGNSGLQITTVAGSIFKNSLTLSNPTVGVLSVLTVMFFTPHNIPSNGQIQLTLPKWNQFDPNQTALVPMIAVDVAPGFVECAPQLGLISPLTSCMFTEGVITDTLIVQLSENAAVVAGRQISVLVQGVRSPPSQVPITGFTLQTSTFDGFIIDLCQNPSTITLSASIPVQGSSNQVELLVDMQTILATSTLTVQYKNVNPLQPGANFIMYIPTDFNIAAGELVLTAWGQSVNPNPIFNLNVVQRKITIQRFNIEYMDSLTQTQFNISGVVNPASTQVTGPFTFQVTDFNSNLVEYIKTGVTFQAKANSFDSVNFTVDNEYVNTQNVNYTFSIIPQNSFAPPALLKLYFPSQLFVSQDATLSNVSANMNVGAQVQVVFGMQVTLINAFPGGYNQGDLIQFTLNGVSNSDTVGLTDPITIKLFYTEFIGEINDYQGSNLTFTTVASPMLQMSVFVDQNFTSQVNQNLLIVGSLPSELKISMGSSLIVFIPNQFFIPDLMRTAQSCIIVSGFSDDIQCSLQSSETPLGYYLTVKNGFDSQTFVGGNFSFQISEIANPSTTLVSGAFNMTVLDSQLRTQYYIGNQTLPLTVQIAPSNFSTATVASLNPANSASTSYQFFITLASDTPVGSMMNVTLPSQTSVDQSQRLTCLGILILTRTLACNFDGLSTISFQLVAIDQTLLSFGFGVTIGFEISNLINPISFAKSDSFTITTFGYDIASQVQFVISESTQNITVQNSLQIPLQILSIIQDGNSGLDQPTSLSFQLQSAVAIPVASNFTFSLPSNLQLSNDYTLVINGQDVASFQVSTDYSTISFITPTDALFQFNISVGKGLANPTNGPYNYSGFQFYIHDRQNYLIASASSNVEWVSVNCGSNCSECAPDLNTCLSCGQDQVKNILFSQLGTTCVSPCPSGMFSDNNNQCQNCSSECLECTISAKMCKKCDPTSATPFVDLVQMTCVNQCAGETYFDNSSSSCIGCTSPCLSCSSASVCLSCNSADPFNKAVFFQMNKSSCLQQCDYGQLPSPSKICVDCEAPCKTCVDQPETCLSCQGGLYLYENQCVASCPYHSYQDNTNMQCQLIVAVVIPFPFTITAFVLTVGVLISCIMIKNQNKHYQNAFFVTMLALVDFILRLNWVILGLIAAIQAQFGTLIWCIVLLAISTALNLLLWRRYFKFKFKLEHIDAGFLEYTHRHPRTSKLLLTLSYAFTFQVIRMMYSKLLNMSQFNGTIDKKRTYYILISRLTLVQVVVLFVPAVAMNIYGLVTFQPSQQLYYIGVDSLVLIIYATILIIVTLIQQERILHPVGLVSFKDLLNYDLLVEDDETRVKVIDVLEESGENSYQATLDDHGIELEVMSASNFDGIKERKTHLYQPQNRNYDSQNLVYARTIDYQQIQVDKFNLLNSKLSKVQLKKELFENRRVSDYKQVQQLSENLHGEFQATENLQLKLDQLRFQLQQVKSNIVQTTKKMNQEIKAIEVHKREEISKRNSASENSQHLQGVSSARNSQRSPPSKRNLSQGPVLAMSLSYQLPKPTNKLTRAKSQGKKAKKQSKKKKVLTAESPADNFTIQEIYQFKPSAVLKSNAVNPFL